jgi:hypothetical protein
MFQTITDAQIFLSNCGCIFGTIDTDELARALRRAPDTFESLALYLALEDMGEAEGFDFLLDEARKEGWEPETMQRLLDDVTADLSTAEDEADRVEAARQRAEEIKDEIKQVELEILGLEDEDESIDALEIKRDVLEAELNTLDTAWDEGPACAVVEYLASVVEAFAAFPCPQGMSCAMGSDLMTALDLEKEIWPEGEGGTPDTDRASKALRRAVDEAGIDY